MSGEGRMQGGRLVAVVAIAVGAAAILWLALARPTFDVSISEEQVAAEIEKALPKSSDGIVDVTLTALDLRFLPGDAVRVRAEAHFSRAGFSGRATTETETGIRYSNGDFFLEDVTIDDLDIVLDEESGAKAADLGTVEGALIGAIAERLSAQDSAAGGAFERMTERAAPHITAALRGLVNIVVGSVPVYTLRDKGTGHDLAALALVDLRFEERRAIATLEPGLAVAKIAAMFVAFVLVPLLWLCGVMHSLASVFRR